MKKILLISIVAAILIIPVASANIVEENEPVTSNVSMEDFTHTVFVEYAAHTTCPYCVVASNQLYSIYNAGDLDFNHVSLVYDAATFNIRNRLQDLGVVAFPRVFFDGGYKDILGAQPDEQAYRAAITQSGGRTVLDIDITVSATLKSGGTIKIEVTVVNNEVEYFNGVLRVFVVEKESRWNDKSGNPFHYAALDIAIDKSLALLGSNVKPLGDTYTFSKTWFGALHGFSDITADNIVIVAALYDPDTGYAVQSASAEPTIETSRFRLINPLLIQRLANWFPILSKLLSL